LEFAEALESRVSAIYKDSWIYQYFNFKVVSENNVVFFTDTTKKILIDSDRFQIFLFIPETTKYYFLPSSQWKNLCSTSECSILTDLISNIVHGFKTVSFPSTKSVRYKLPYFIIFNSPSAMSNNYLVFKDFLKPNFEDKILAMIKFDEEKNGLVPYFTPLISFPFLKTLTLNKTLEFILVDSNKKQILISDHSQLFISIKFSI
jgi:hypothetical protein